MLLRSRCRDLEPQPAITSQSRLLVQHLSKDIAPVAVRINLLYLESAVSNLLLQPKMPNIKVSELSQALSGGYASCGAAVAQHY
eukprot:6483155-Amphidinium_carterae.1